MTNQEIYELMDRFQRSGLHSIKLAVDGQQIELTRSAGSEPAPMISAAAVTPAAATSAVVQQDQPTITAPLAGVFYAAPAPDQPPFVTAGQRVVKGQTVCLIEAMKMMSEIPAPCDGIIEAVLKGNGELAEFHEPLIRYRAV